MFCSRHEKDARKRYSQRAEDPLRVCLGRELYDLFPYCIESIKKRGQCYGPLLFDPILTGDENIPYYLGLTSRSGPCFYGAGPISRTCSVCPPFVECPARFTGLLAYQALARCSCRPLDGRSARYPYCSLCWGPPIALDISYGSSSSQPQGAALRGQSGLSSQSPFELR